ncbi:MAG: FaeA/PapI family transcriptional regulator [Methanoregula sp.]|jgi:ATP-dependent DNA helicase RecG
MKAEYVRAKGFEPLQQEQMIIDYVKEHGIIRRAEVADLYKISDDQEKRLLKSISEKHEELKMVGARRGAHYIWEGHRR